MLLLPDQTRARSLDGEALLKFLLPFLLLSWVSVAVLWHVVTSVLVAGQELGPMPTMPLPDSQSKQNLPRLPCPLSQGR